MAKQPNSNFGGILDDVTPRSTPLPKQSKPKQLNIPIDAELMQMLDRAVYHKGKKSNKLLYVTNILKEALKADSDSLKPIPGEED